MPSESMATTTPPADGPRITVLTAAFSRKEFLPRAVRSVIASTLPRDRYEIVVVKNFVDSEVDALLEANGVRVLNEGPGPVGAYMARALAAARGQVVCLLNDDDEFEPGKLAVVLERFDSVPELVYYHDRRTLIDEEGRPLPTAGRWGRTEAPAFAIRTDADRRRLVGRVHRSRGLFHDSCISVRREVLEAHSADLATVVVSEDAFTYYCALAATGTLYFDDRRLTRFRVHALSKYRKEKTGTRDPSVQAKRRALVQTIDRITAGTSAAPAASVFRLVTAHQAYLEVEGGQRPRAAEYWGLAVCFLRYRVPTHAVLLALSVLKTVAPRTTGAFFARFWTYLDDTVT